MSKIKECIKSFFKYVFKHIYTRICFILLCVIIFLQLVFYIPGLSDFYILHIYPIWLNTWGRVGSILPISFAELVVGTLILFIITLIISLIILIFKRKSNGYKHYMLVLTKILIMGIIVDTTLESLVTPAFKNASKIEVPVSEKREYTSEETKILRDYIVSKCNELAPLMERNEKGYALYNKSYVQESKKAMLNISSSYPRLKGYYPNAKGMISSRFQTITRCLGVTYFDTLSVNYNKECYSLSIPATITHEYSHIKGYIKEDEANFLAFVACISYEDVFFQYSGYLSVLDYIDWDYYCSDKENYEHYSCDELVYNDNTAFDWEALEEIEKSPIDTDVIGDISNDITDINIKINGDSLGFESYNYVTKQLLKYYDGVLY